MLRTKDVAESRSAEYALPADFCRIFNQDMNSLYLLASLLAGDREKAERCFVGGLDDALGRNTVFKEWARSWARRVIVQNALRIVDPRPGKENKAAAEGLDKMTTERPEIAAVLALQSFDRFVFVMSVLERYADHDCAILLNCTRKDVVDARMRALEQLGETAQLLQTQQLETAARTAEVPGARISAAPAAA